MTPTPTKPTAEHKYQRARELLGAAAEAPATPSSDTPITAARPPDQLRLRRVCRDRVTAIPARLADLLPADHLARLIWDAVTRLDLTAFYAPIVVVVGGPGQAATDPQILVALWLYALSQGVTSARALNDLCVEHLAYIWLCGGVTMNYHTLSDFRTQQLQALDDLLTQVLACLDQAGLIAYEHTAQDGMRVRAAAGAASFRREATLEKRLAEAQAVVAALTAPPAAATETHSAREQAAQERAATERVARLEAALAELPAAQAAKPAAEQAEARVSTTDPQARVMKMADGGYRPAYNFEFATDTAHRVIVGVDVTNAGSDKAELTPMLDQVAARGDAGRGGHRHRQRRAHHRPRAPTQRPHARPDPALGDRLTRRRGVARPHGHHRGQSDLQTAGGDQRVRQCPGAQSARPAATACAGLAESVGCGVVDRHHA